MKTPSPGCRIWIHGLAWLMLGGWCDADSRPNIVMVVVDDLPQEMCTFAGGDPARNLTPTIDRLAAEAVVLSGMHSPAPICTPSRYAILTGRYPSRSTAEEFRATTERYGQSVVRFNTLLVPSDDTLPRQLQRAGYTTAFFGKSHVVEARGYRPLPFTTSVDTPEARQILARNAEVLRGALRSIGFDVAERVYVGNPDADGVRQLAVHNQDWITEGAVQFLHRPHDKPFFLYLATTVPHGPVEDDRSWKADRRITPEGVLPQPPVLHSSADAIARRTAAAGLQGRRRETLLWMDDAVEELMSTLGEIGLLEDTILVFLSDHGTRAKGSLYAEGTNTPCFLWRRGGFGKKRLSTTASLIDLAPTLLEWAGADIGPTELDGKSLVPAIAGEVAEVHESLYFEVGFSRAVQRRGLKYLALRYPPGVQMMSIDERSRVLEANNAWLASRGRPVLTTDPLAPFSHLSSVPGGSDAERVSIGRYPAYYASDQLYDLRSDPHEQVNLFGDPAYAERRQDLRRLLHDYVSGLADRFGEFGGAEFTP